ncbi:flagellar protein FliT [Stutzerimonas sp. VN223-3]|uniref:flagellar protein FliT n=1 Tax=Stutzerimonas sp. VN223-3 TaxID=3384601 RepID=UPI0038B5BC9B
MLSRKQEFVTLTEALRVALAAGEWTAITALDKECLALVAALRDEDALDAGLREQLEELSRLYDEVRERCRAERERLVGELTRLSQSKQVNRAYKLLG